MKKFTKLISLLVLSAGAVNAAVVVMDTATYNGTTYDNDPSFTISAASFGSFDPNGTDKLVLTVGSRGGSATNLLFGSVTYNGSAMSVAATGPASRDAIGIFYLDNPSAAGDLVINLTGTTGLNVAVSLISLDGTAAGVGPTNSASGLSASLTTTADNSLIVGAAITSAAGGLTITPQSPMVAVQSGASSTTSYAAAGSGYYELATAGSFSASFSASGGTQQSTVLAAFAPIPEPSAAFLVSFGMLVLLRRRR